MIFTPQDKDRILYFLVFVPGNWSDNFRPLFENMLEGQGVTLRQIRPLLEYFERLKFIRLRNSLETVSYYIEQEAVDFVGRGGFVAQEEIFEKNINKLLVEIEVLKAQLTPDKQESIAKLTTIASDILSGLTIIKSI